MNFSPLRNLAWVILMAPVQFATAQTAPLKHTAIDYSVSSGGQPEAFEQETVIFDHLVEIDDAPSDLGLPTRSWNREATCW